MLTKIKIDGFKNLSNVEVPLKPLTIVTGKNSTGKSSLLQATLHTQINTSAFIYYQQQIKPDFNLLRNKYLNAKKIDIKIDSTEGSKQLILTEEQLELHLDKDFPSLEEGLFYLSANRIGAENTVGIYPALVSGPNGEALLSSFERNKSRALDQNLIKDTNSYTLATQVNYWLSYIMGVKLELYTENRQTQIEVRYNSDDLPGILPSNLGAGISYLAKIIILCLLAKKGDTIMMENPEIHLYPLAQCRLAEFISFIVSSGRQLIIETHSNDLITKIRHEVYKGKLNADLVEVLYKDNISDDFKLLDITRNGAFSEDFPESFFDATLNELLEME